MEVNEDVWDLWASIRTQWRGAGMGILGLDYPVVWAKADKMGIDYSPCVERKIMALEHYQLSNQGVSDDNSDGKGALKAAKSGEGRIQASKQSP